MDSEFENLKNNLIKDGNIGSMSKEEVMIFVKENL